MGSRGLRWAALLAALVAVYALAGFWGVPALVRWQLPKAAAQQLERPASVGEVRFNPFTLRLRAQQIRLADTDGSPLLVIARIDTQLRWRSLLPGPWSFAHLSIEAPQARLAISPDGGFNLAALVDALRRHRQAGERGDARLPSLLIQDFALTQGRLEWDDRRVGFHTVLAPLELRFARLSTQPNERDPYQLSADVAGGGRVRWRGEASLNPIQAAGEIVLQDLPLPALGAYLRPYARVVVASGRLSATLPYRLQQQDGRYDARLLGARLAIADLAAAHADGRQPFAALRQVEVRDVEADLLQREAVVGAVQLAGGRLDLRRDEHGTWDVGQLLVERTRSHSAPERATPWKAAVRQLQLSAIALRLVDATMRPAATLTADSVGGQLRLDAAQTAEALATQVNGGSLQVDRLALVQPGRPPLVLGRVGLEQATADLAGRRLEAQRLAIEGGQLHAVRDAQGRVDLLALVPASAPTPQARNTPAWTARLAQLAVSGLTVDLEDQGSGIRTQLQDVALHADDVGTDLTRPVRFEGGLHLRGGGQLALRGQAVPAQRSLQAEVQLQQLPLAQAQPLLARHLRLKLASGTLDTQGRLEASFPQGRAPDLRYTGRAMVDNLRLNELDGTLFARWRSVAAERLAVGTGGLDIPELRVVAPEASLIIEPDRSFNAARLLVKQPAQPVPASARRTARAPGADAAFPVRIHRLRLQDARLAFLDQSLRPQFGARIYALNGVVTGLSTRRDARSQVELDGRVDTAGLARIRGALNPFAPRDNTDLFVEFRNVDMVPASPYSMKFAGYRIAEGRISMDLHYLVRDSQLVGENKVVIDRLTLGERVESPDALKLPLELAIAVLKDPNGRIDLGIPVTGDLRDPQFSWGGLIWKAVVNVVTRVVSAPFRALGHLFGMSGEKLEAVDFDPGSGRLLPPERDKLRQVADVLAKRSELRLSVPGAYDEKVDGAALRAAAVRSEIVRRAGIRLQPGEAPGPLDFGDRAVRTAVHDLYVLRFGEASWNEAKTAAERERPRGEANGGSPSQGLPVWRRLRNFVQGEPQVADAGPFYRGLVQRLEQQQPLAPGALAQLGSERAQAVVAALTGAGVDSSRATAGPPAAVQAGGGASVPLRLELATR